MKTAITILQEMMMRMGQTPEYECISQSGPQHLAMFEYKCVADGEVGTGVARSKKEAKQEAARAVLAALKRRGGAVPPEAVAPAPASVPAAPRCHVALLRELAEQYRLPAVTFELIGDSGPPHMRRFTVRAAIAEHGRHASATTKKLARDLAAEQLYMYLRENLRVTRDFAEDEALARAHDRAMDRYRETRDDLPWRPDLGQKVADYHLALLNQLSHDGDVPSASMLLRSGDDVEGAALALGLRVERGASELGPATVALTPTSPPLVFAGCEEGGALAAAARFLRLALALALAPTPPPPPRTDDRDDTQPILQHTLA